MNNRPVIVGIGSIQQKGNFDESLDEALVLMDLAFKKSLDDTNNMKSKTISKNSDTKRILALQRSGKWIAEKND